jgi:NADH:ubiquinone oxidoreductase subunit 6 (subunit J)
MGNSSSATISNITNTTAKNILSALQRSQTNANVQQQIYGVCDTELVQSLSKQYTDCLLKYFDYWSPDDLIEICSVYTDICKMSNIDMNSSLNMTNLTQADASIKQEIKQSVSNTLSQYGGNNSDQYISNITDASDTISTKIVEDLVNSGDIIQSINLNATSGNFISMDSSINVINKSLQSIDVFQKNVTSISNIITQTADNSHNTYTIFLILFGIIAISGIMISIIMTLRRSSGIDDFFNRMMPSFIWLILSLLVTVIHIIAKPGYVSFTDKDGNKQLNQTKLFYTLFGYYVVLFLIIFTIYKIKQKK